MTKDACTRWAGVFLVLAVLCGRSHQYKVGNLSPWMVGQTINSHHIRTAQVQTKLQCAIECTAEASCHAIATQTSPSGIIGDMFDCELKSEALVPYTFVSDPTMCYSLMESREEYTNGGMATQPPAVSTTAVSSAVAMTTTAPATETATETTTATATETATETTTATATETATETTTATATETATETTTAPATETATETTTATATETATETTTATATETATETTTATATETATETTTATATETATETTTATATETATETTTVSETTTATTNQPTIITATGNLNGFCTGSSMKDIAILTSDGVYIYDDMAALTSGGPCSGPHLLATKYTGYSGSKSLPAITNVVCTMVHQDNFIDLYSNNQVWRWQVHSGYLQDQGLQSFPKTIESHLGVTTLQKPPSNSDWCVNRFKSGRADKFFYNNDKLYFYSDQSPYRDVYAPSATGKTNNGYNLNPWTKLPNGTIGAVFSVTTNYDDFIMVTQDGTVHRYQMDHENDSNNPPVSVSNLGQLITGT